MTDDDFDLLPVKPYWRCTECGHEDHTKPLPVDRAKYYRNPYAAKCPQCKSDGLIPEGW